MECITIDETNNVSSMENSNVLRAMEATKDGNSAQRCDHTYANFY